MLTSLLIANRGEIACRIIRTARAMGIRIIAVHSDADATALHVRMADEAVPIGPAPARDSYLVGATIIAAAQQTGAQAIHPGYGFLSENADFAQAVLDAGLIWVGPSPASIRAMGLKDAAKTRMIAAGVPVTPGYLGEDQSPARLQTEADTIGYPILIKAVAGGGGKGMRRVDAPADFTDALAACQREAAASFGDDRVILEKYILAPRHIEVQVFGDTHGNIVHLFERDCSLQRRHQKVIEEAPAPGMTEFTRAFVCAAAVRAAHAVDYVGAGTIEFIADGSSHLHPDRIWFMEMNTRLQVEHPVTEAITGVDLVEWQLRIASGEPLPLSQNQLSIDGHAIEARLYAEDPARGFLPSTGRLDVLDFPQEDSRLRIDTGVEQGSIVSPYYDPMLAKIIAHGPDREEALSTIEDAMRATLVWPVKSNAGFLARLTADEDVRAGRLTTALIADKLDALCPQPEPDDALIRTAAAAWLMRARDGAPPNGLMTAHGETGLQSALTGFRLNGPRHSRIAITLDGQPHEIAFKTGEIGQTFALPVGVDEEVAFRWHDDTLLLSRGADTVAVQLARTDGTGSALASDGAILAPMPGRITAVEVAQGDRVTKGQKLLTLEAMKMEHSLTAPFDGTIAELHATPGAQVQVEALLARIEPVAEA